MNLSPIQDDSTSTLFRDVIMLALAGFITLVMLILPHINPVAKTEQDAKSPGEMSVEIFWPDDINADIDLWVQAPTDVPVGYSNKNGKVFNLLRDDLGHGGDLSGRNYEFAFTRGIESGEYTVNAHFYRGNGPVSVKVIVSLRTASTASMKQILAKDLVLDHAGQELTVFRFGIDTKSMLAKGSVHDVPKALRSNQ